MLVILFSCLLLAKKDTLVPKTKVLYINLIYIALAGCSMIWATNFSEALFSVSKIIMGLLVMLLVYNALIIKQKQAFIGLLTASGILLAVYICAGIIQYARISGTSFTELYDISGINGHKNLLSAMLFMLSSFLLTAIPFLKNRFTKAIPIAIYVISMTFVVLLKSRATLTGYMVSIMVFVIVLIFRKKQWVANRRWRLIFSTLAIVISFVFFTLVLRQATFSIVEENAQGTHTEYDILSASSMYERLALWDNTYQLSDEKPFWGCGLGNWKVEIQGVGTLNLYRCDMWNINFVRPHNEFLGLLSECGYITLLVYLIFICSLIVYAFFEISKLKNIKDFIVGAVALAIFMGANIIAVFDFPNERIEFIVWINIIIAILYVILSRNNTFRLNFRSNLLFVALSIMLVIIGIYRYIGEYYTYDMQKAIRANDLQSTIKYSSKSISSFYNIDPVGYPIHWYQGHAMLMRGDKRAKYALRKAYKNAPYCKQNLNDLGFVMYYEDHNLEAAEYYLREAMRISPNFVNSGFNLVGIFMNEKEYNKARMVLDLMYTDEAKRDMLLRDAEYFAPDNLEVETRRIMYDYNTNIQLQHIVDSLRLQVVE